MNFLTESMRRFFGKDDIKGIDTRLKHKDDSGWQGSDGFKYREWYSPDGKNSVTITVCDGPEYEGVVMKDVHLYAIGEVSVSKAEIMRVQSVIRPGSQEAGYNIYLDAITEEEDGWILTNVAFFSHDRGRRYSPDGCSNPLKRGKYKRLSDEEFRKQYIEEMTSAGVYRVREVLPEIDIEPTVVSFIAQIQKLDFSKPVLVPKHPGMPLSSVRLLGL